MKVPAPSLSKDSLAGLQSPRSGALRNVLSSSKGTIPSSKVLSSRPNHCSKAPPALGRVGLQPRDWGRGTQTSTQYQELPAKSLQCVLLPSPLGCRHNCCCRIPEASSLSNRPSTHMGGGGDAQSTPEPAQQQQASRTGGPFRPKAQPIRSIHVTMTHRHHIPSCL